MLIHYRTMTETQAARLIANMSVQQGIEVETYTEYHAGWFVTYSHTIFYLDNHKIDIYQNISTGYCSVEVSQFYDTGKD